MGSKRGRPMPRDRLVSSRERRTRPDRRRSDEKSFFVPSLSVHRPIVPSDELTEFVHDLGRLLPRNYKIRDIGRMGMTILAQKSLVNQFRKIDVQPEPEEIENVAHSMQGGLKLALYGVSRKLEIPTGRISIFGDNKHNRTQIGVEPRGWKGHAGKYSENDAEGKKLPMPILVRESDLIYGHIINTLGDHEGLLDGIVSHSVNRTPHITLASKSRGGSISESEAAGIAGVIDEVMPASLSLFDPVTYLRATPKMRDQETIFARRPTEFYRRMFTR